jgi:hypothetical protein
VKTATESSSNGRATGPQAFHNGNADAMALINWREVM